MNTAELTDWLLDSLCVDLPHTIEEAQPILSEDSSTHKIFRFDGLPYEFVFSLHEIEATCNEQRRLEFSRTLLHNGTFAEQPFRVISSAGIGYFLETLISAGKETTDTATGNSFRINRPSNAYIAATFDACHHINDMIAPVEAISTKVRNTRLNVFDVVRHTFEFITLQVRTSSVLNEEELRRWLLSLSFELSSPTGVALVPIDDFGPPSIHEMKVRRRRHPHRISPPHQNYTEAAVRYYQSALANPSPHYQFLAFFNVLETQFPHRGRAVDQLQPLLEVVVPDTESLRRQLGDDISAYYSEEPAHSDAVTKVNWNTNRTEIIRALADRIRKTRNSIVHTKDESHIPLRDDSAVMWEVPLVKLLAERTISKRA